MVPILTKCWILINTSSLQLKKRAEIWTCSRSEVVQLLQCVLARVMKKQLYTSQRMWYQIKYGFWVFIIQRWHQRHCSNPRAFWYYILYNTCENENHKKNKNIWCKDNDDGSLQTSIFNSCWILRENAWTPVPKFLWKFSSYSIMQSYWSTFHKELESQRARHYSITLDLLKL